jgi:hypothetical protein
VAVFAVADDVVNRVVASSVVAAFVEVGVQEGILSRNILSREVYASWSGFLACFQDISGGKNCLFSRKNL